MTYVIQLGPSSPEIDASLIKSLHFMIMKYDLSKRPGEWRQAAVWIQNEHGDVVYEAPDRDLVDGLSERLMRARTRPEAVRGRDAASRATRVRSPV